MHAIYGNLQADQVDRPFYVYYLLVYWGCINKLIRPPVLADALPHNNSLLAIVCAGILVTYLSFIQTTGAIPAFAQIDITTPDIITSSVNASSSINSSLPIGGPNLLLYTKSGGLAHTNQLYAFNILSQELVFVDLNNNTVKKRMLTDDEISTITDAFSSALIPDHDVYDINPCPDCIQYGLVYSFIDFETRIELNDLSFWTDTTQGTERLTAIGQTMEDLAGHQMTNATLASVR
jgi:hypothetical protein